MTVDLKGRVAAISGGLGDIGRAIARELGRHGASVALADRRTPQEAMATLEELRAMGAEAQYSLADVSEVVSVDAWLDSAESSLGTPDIIVANAAVCTAAGVREITAEQWRRDLAVDLDGAFFVAMGGIRRLLANRQPGHVVFVGSWAGSSPHPQVLAYGVAKAGVRMLMRSLALDLAPDGIMVNEVAPGYVNGGLARPYYEADNLLRQVAESQIPTGRLVEPDEVAAQVLRLCDPAAPSLTGTTITLDGGLSLVSAFELPRDDDDSSR